jgi:hypothetical protein
VLRARDGVSPPWCRTVVSLSPWNTIVGTAGRSGEASERWPRIAAIAETASRADAYGRPE